MNIDLPLSIILIIYTIVIAYSTKYIYHFMINRNIKKKDAIYYNRKFVHILAGGVVTLFIPFYSTPVLPLLAGLALTFITFFSHEKGGKLYWFQTDQDYNDVNFCFMWGISIFILWTVLGYPNRWIAIIPAAFMAFGDGITGIVRNKLFNRRLKHPIGNVFMAAVCIPLGYIYAGIGSIAYGGVFAAIIASIAERFEFGPIDDNVLITISSSIVLYVYSVSSI